jgi:excisionase family DNA binding protein
MATVGNDQQQLAHAYPGRGQAAMGRHSAPESEDGWSFTLEEVHDALTVDQVARALGVSRSTVNRMSIKGELPYVTMGAGRGHRVYPLRGIDAYIDERTGGGRHLAAPRSDQRGQGK